MSCPQFAGCQFDYIEFHLTNFSKIIVRPLIGIAISECTLWHDFFYFPSKLSLLEYHIKIQRRGFRIFILILYRMKSAQKIIILLAALLFITNCCHPQCAYCIQEQNMCIACKGDFELTIVGGSCHENTISNCQLYGPSDECVRCRPTFTLVEGKCVKTFDGCVSSVDNYECYQCGYNTLLQGLKCKGVLNCKIFSEVCTQCRNNYQLMNNMCKDVSEGCAETSPQNGTCTKCKNGYQMSGYQCIKKEKLNPRCYVHESQSKCYICKEGYREQEGYCLLPEEPLPQANFFTDSFIGPGDFGGTGGFSSNTVQTQTQTQTQVITMEKCEVPDPGSSGCLICVYGYVPKQGGCQQVSKFCDGHNVQTGECFGCKFGLTNQNGICVDQNCQNTGANGCSACKTGFKPNSNNVCEASDENCMQSFNGRCQECKTGFYTDITGICKKLPANCAFANIQTGQCLECEVGFEISAPGGPCMQKIVIQNCQVYDPQNPSGCLICEYGYYPSGNQCKKVSVLCKDHNVKNGDCVSCISTSHQLSGGKCKDPNCQIAGPNGQSCSQCASGFVYNATEYACKFSDPNCKTLGPKQCLQCKTGFYVSTQGKCNMLPANCLAAQPTGTCYNCANGYQLSNGICQYFQQQTQPQTQPNTGFNTGFNSGSANTPTNTQPTTTNNQANTNTQQITDPNCLSYNGNFCTKCSSRYYVYGDGKCVPVNPLCKDYNLRGECTTCYQGYEVNSGKCVIESARDPNCKKQSGNSCIECYNGYFYSQEDRSCKRLNPLCKTSNLVNGYCQTCYPGYSLNPANGNCEVFFKDPNCINFSGNLCIQCSKGFYSGTDGKCLQNNPLCKTSNPTNGACQTCYPGYTLSGRDCVVGADKDPNCKTFNGDSCIECFNTYYLNSGSRKCTKVNPLCKTFNNANGNCLTCYPGYDVQGGLCVLTSRDPNCKTFNGNQCVECFNGYLAIQGKCLEQNPLCKDINKNNGQCLSCWQGYNLYGGDCLIQQSNNPTGQQEDLYCIKYQNNVCQKCSNGYYLDSSSKKCSQVDPLCKTSDPNNGACMSCYLGYSISGRSCIATVSASQIPNCVAFTPAGLCTECLDGYYVSGNTCAAVSILCTQYNKQTGQCLSCIPGYFFQDNECIYPALPDPYCVRYSGAYCSICRNGFYLVNYMCKQIHAQCAAFDYDRQVCTACVNNYTPRGPECV